MGLIKGCYCTSGLQRLFSYTGFIQDTTGGDTENEDRSDHLGPQRPQFNNEPLCVKLYRGTDTVNFHQVFLINRNKKHK